MPKEKIEKGTVVYIVNRTVPHILKVRKVVDIVIEDGTTKLSLVKNFSAAHNLEMINFPSDNLFLSDTRAMHYQMELCISTAKRELDGTRTLKDLYTIFKRALNISWYPDQETIPIILGGETQDNRELQNERYWMEKNQSAKNVYLDALIGGVMDRKLKSDTSVEVAGSIQFD